MTVPTPENLAFDKSDIKIVIAIPARLGSTRLPRKPLASLAGRPLIVWVAEKVADCAKLLGQQMSLSSSEIITLVATDSSEIAEALKKNRIRTVMTTSELPSGTDRIEAALSTLQQSGLQLTESTLIINLQGDEPFFCIDDIVRLAEAMQSDKHAPMGTLAFPQSSPEYFIRSSVVKVTRNALGNALYFSRAPIAWPRNLWGASDPITALSEKMQKKLESPFLQHVGIYAYRLNALRKFTQMEPSFLELSEGLEQLRALEAGWNIKVIDAKEAPFGIDTADDLLRAETYLNKQGQSI